MNNTIKAHLALLGANLIYSASFTIAKEVMPAHIGPLGFVFLRALGTTIMFWLIATLFIKEKISRKHIPKAALLGLFGVAINQMLFLKGLSITTPINAAILMVSTPILVLIISGILLKEKISYINISGISIGFIGAAMLLLIKSDLSFGSSTMKGDFFIFINALSWGIYLVLAKPLMKIYNTITLLKWVFLFGFIYVTPFGYSEFSAVQWHLLTPYAWFCIAFMVILVTVIAYLLNTYALKELSSSVVSAYIYLQPLLAAIIALWAQKDKLNWLKIIAAILIFIGVYLASKKSEKPQNI